MKYEKQKTSKSCGAAVAKMVADHYEIDISQDKLIQQLDIEDVGYTRKKALRQVFDRLQLEYEEFAERAAHGKVEIVNQSHLERLLDKVDEGKPIIVNISRKNRKGERDGHYVIVHGYDEEHIITHDPDKGENHKISKKEFLENWVSGNEKWKKWYMVITGKKE